mgnify:CR=1 FL=1
MEIVVTKSKMSKSTSNNTQSAGIILDDMYHQFAKQMLNLSARILNDVSAAEDVIQDAFIAGHQNLNKFNNAVDFGNWLKRVVVNKSIDVLRKRNNMMFEIDEDTLNVGQQVADEEEPTYTIQNVMDAIKQLPDGYRIVLNLFLFEGFAHKEIASTLNISEGTSKSQYNRARKKLIQIIKSQNTII